MKPLLSLVIPLILPSETPFVPETRLNFTCVACEKLLPDVNPKNATIMHVLIAVLIIIMLESVIELQNYFLPPLSFPPLFHHHVPLQYHTLAITPARFPDPLVSL